ncbi:hypothetical protein [Endothiovibrio diazotrophicus]
MVIASENLADQGTLSGGDWALPLANLQDRSLAVAAQSSDATPASTRLTVAWDRVIYWRVLAIPRSNLSREATIRVVSYRDEAQTEQAYDSGEVYVFPRMYTSTAPLLWGALNWWDGRPLEKTIALYRRPYYLVLPAVSGARAITIEIADPDNPDGHVELSRLFVSSGWAAEWNISWGASPKPQSRSLMVEGAGGARFYDRRDPRRTFAAQHRFLTQQEAWERVYDLQMAVDVVDDLVVIPDPADTPNLMRRSMYCTLAKLDGVEPYAYGLNGTSWQFEEIL